MRSTGKGDLNSDGEVRVERFCPGVLGGVNDLLAVLGTAAAQSVQNIQH